MQFVAIRNKVSGLRLRPHARIFLMLTRMKYGPRTCYTTLYSSSFIVVPCLFVVSLIIIWITKLSIEAC